MITADTLIEALNAPEATGRLAALRELKKLYENGSLPTPVPGKDVNNHIHTTYSFSPYSPTKAAYMAWINGLTTAGIMDHDSVAGAEEFTQAGEVLGIATTAGFECRCTMDGTPFEGFRINNPDQNSVAYLAAHGIPHQNFQKAQQWLAPYREQRNLRNRRMVENINTLLLGTGLELDFDRDVAAISMDRDGGSITERHILYALSLQMLERVGTGQKLLGFLLEKLEIEVPGKTREKLLGKVDAMYAYYLLGVLKSSMVEKFYIPATEECPPVAEFIRFVTEIGAIPAYAYLGDVGDSVTGDKKAQTFEDAYLDELVPWLAKTGFTALTYMPTRNTAAQLDRLIGLCEANGLFQISGEDINSPFQSFHCAALQKPRFQHLAEATWALIGHERSATENLEQGMFSRESLAKMPELTKRIRYFADIARETAGKV